MQPQRNRKLKKYICRSNGIKYRNHTIYVAAYGDVHASQMLSMALHGEKFPNLVSTHEIVKYANKGTWGNFMPDTEPTEPCVYVKDRYTHDEPRLVVPKKLKKKC